jgi:membrane protein
MALSILGAIGKRAIHERVFERAAALSFHALLAGVPLLAILVIFGNILIGQEILEDSVIGYVQMTLGAQAASLFLDVFQQIDSARHELAIPAVGLVVLWFALHNLFTLLRQSLASIFNVRTHTPIRSHVLFKFMVQSVVSLLFGMLLIFIAVIQFAVSVTAHALAAKAGVEQLTYVAPLLGGAFTFVLLWVFFSVTYLIAAAGTIRKRTAVASGVIASTLFLIATILLSLVYTYAQTADVYGTVAPIVATMLWVYYIACVFLTGAAAAATIEGKRQRADVPNPVEVAQEAVQAVARGAKRVGEGVVSLRKRDR